MNRKGKSDLLVLGLFILAVLVLTGTIKLGSVTMPSLPSGGVGYATTLSAGATNAITGATDDVNAEVFANDNSWVSGEVNVNALPTTISTSAPNSLDGYMIIGNDANQGTDRGTEVYRRKIPVHYVNKGTYQIPDTDGSVWVKLYDEGTPTWTGYDDGSAESPLNITIGSGQTVTSVELKIAAPADACIGNPDFDHPIGVCFNASDTSKFDEIRPASFVGKFEPCEAFNGKNIVGDCYILPAHAICDYEEYRFAVVIDAASGVNPDASDFVNAIPMDLTWYKNDQGMWEAGWCDDSEEGTDYDPGIDGLANAKTIYLN